jgi:preprotein translocase subunit SecE
MKNPFRSTRIFLGEMVGELQKATWPTKAELRDSTVVVVLAALILGLFTSISDFSLYQVVSLFRLGQLITPPCPPKRPHLPVPNGSRCTRSPARRTR